MMLLIVWGKKDTDIVTADTLCQLEKPEEAWKFKEVTQQGPGSLVPKYPHPVP